jgi:acyl-CoA thioesterase II
MSRLVTSLSEQIGVEELSQDAFISKSLPVRMGNSTKLAYGGCSLGVAVHAACKSVPSSFLVYSILGHFLGPAMTDQKLTCRVYRIRDTRTFATRRVVVTQPLENGGERECLQLVADFQTKETPLLSFSAPPSIQYSDAKESPTMDQHAERLAAAGQIDERAAKGHIALFSMLLSFFETRPCIEGISCQNLAGGAKRIETTQDHLPITSKTSAEWQRATRPLRNQEEQAAALAFLMDGGLSFLPLIHDHRFLEDAGACSSLDFALRIFVPTIDIMQWHLKERKAIAAHVGRTYSESRLWNQSGAMVASMTQQCILRPKFLRAAI